MRRRQALLLVLLTSCGVLSAQVPTRVQEVDDAKLLDLLKQAAFGKGPLPTPLDHRCRLIKFDGVVHALVVQQVGLHNEKMNWTSITGEMPASFRMRSTTSLPFEASRMADVAHAR